MTYVLLKQGLIYFDAEMTGQLSYNELKIAVELVPLLCSDKEYIISVIWKSVDIVLFDINSHLEKDNYRSNFDK